MKYDPNIESRNGITLIDEHRVRKEAQLSTREGFDYTRAVVKHFIRKPDPMVVPVYTFEVIEETPEKESRYGTYIYAYEMMRLGMLSRDERAVIDVSYPYYHNGIPVDVKHDILQMGWRSYPKLLKFLNVVFQQQRYSDIHSGNFMKDQDGDYRIIDLEGFNGSPLNQPKNDWITR